MGQVSPFVDDPLNSLQSLGHTTSSFTNKLRCFFSGLFLSPHNEGWLFAVFAQAFHALLETFLCGAVSNQNCRLLSHRLLQNLCSITVCPHANQHVSHMRLYPTIVNSEQWFPLLIYQDKCLVIVVFFDCQWPSIHKHSGVPLYTSSTN